MNNKIIFILSVIGLVALLVILDNNKRNKKSTASKQPTEAVQQTAFHTLPIDCKDLELRYFIFNSEQIGPWFKNKILLKVESGQYINKAERYELTVRKASGNFCHLSASEYAILRSYLRTQHVTLIVRNDTLLSMIPFTEFQGGSGPAPKVLYCKPSSGTQDIVRRKKRLPKLYAMDNALWCSR